MSLVSSITADMQYSMMASDCEDKSADIAAKLKSVTEQGADLGKTIAGIDAQLDNVKYGLREMQIGESQASLYANNPQAQQIFAQIPGKRKYAEQVRVTLQQQKQLMEAEKKRLAAQEKILTAEQIKNDTMKKFADGASQKFKGYVDGAIKRFFGGGQ